MARYEHLPIYRDALALAVHFEQIVAGFSRYHKYTLGTELRNASRKTVTLIIRANNQPAPISDSVIGGILTSKCAITQVANRT